MPQAKPAADVVPLNDPDAAEEAAVIDNDVNDDAVPQAEPAADDVPLNDPAGVCVNDDAVPSS